MAVQASSQSRSARRPNLRVIDGGGPSSSKGFTAPQGETLLPAGDVTDQLAVSVSPDPASSAVMLSELHQILAQMDRSPAKKLSPRPTPHHVAPHVSNFARVVAKGADSLVRSGYIYPPNLTSRYYYVPYKVGCCADFVADSFGKAGFNLNHVMSAKGYNPHYVPSMVDYFKSHQQYIAGNRRAHVGDAIFFSWGNGTPDHTAIVTAVDGSGQPTQMAESYNFNRRARLNSNVPVNDILGFGRVIHP